MKIDVGYVVQSSAGRDKGRYYTVIAVVDRDFVRVCDGETRTQDNPKRKRIKHLKPNGDILTKIAEKFAAGKQVFDAEIRSALRVYNEKKSEEL